MCERGQYVVVMDKQRQLRAIAFKEPCSSALSSVYAPTSEILLHRQQFR